MVLPIYKKIENDIKEKIQDGTFKSGDLLPSENELKDQYNVSRMTVRQALTNLVNDGYLYRHKGKGTFISYHKIEKSMHGVRSFTEEMESIGRKVSSRVLLFKRIAAPKEIAGKLFLEENDEVIHVERVRYGDDVPVLYEQLFIPANLFKTISDDKLNGSLYEYIEKELMMSIAYCKQSIEAISADTKVSSTLKVSKNAPTLLIVRNTFLSNGRPFEFVKSYYRADSYKFVQHAVRT